MEIKNLKRKELRNVKICVRITKKASKFMHDNDISPSVLVMEALKGLGFKE